MKTKFAIFCILFSWSLFSCGNNTDSEKRVESVPVDGSISSIIRNPATANAPLDTVNVAKISFEVEEYNFGEVNEGDKVIYTFRFSNTGKVPLLITDARSSCGCTVPSWPKEAIAPGGEGNIDVVFNTENKIKQQRKEIAITANTYPSRTEVALVGYVHEKK